MTNYTSKDVIQSLTTLTEDEISQSWLDWADAECNKLLPYGMTFHKPTVDETLEIDGPGDKEIILSKYPIVSITSIVCDGVTINKDTFAIYNDTGIIKVLEGINIDYYGLDEVFAKGTKNIKITGKFGFSEVPRLVEELATLLILNLIRTKTGEGDIRSEKIGDYSISYFEGGGQLSGLERSIIQLKNLIRKDINIEEC